MSADTIGAPGGGLFGTYPGPTELALRGGESLGGLALGGVELGLLGGSGGGAFIIGPFLAQ